MAGGEQKKNQICPEENFVPIFQKFEVFFYNQIRTRGWQYLLHELPEEAYNEFLVRKFYDGFGKRDIYHHNGRITVRWDGTLRVVDLELISGITGIPLRDGDISTPLPIDDYLPWMGRDCVKRDGGGIKTSSVYRNVYATGRWIKANILGSMHVSSFYRE